MARLQFKAELYDKRQRKAQAALSARLRKIFEQMCKEAAVIGASTNFHDPDKEFYLKDFPKANKAISALLRGYSAKITELIDEGTAQAWGISDEKNNALVSALASRKVLTAEQYNAFKPRNFEGLAAFRERRVNGLNLSERVWDFVKNDKNMLEMALEVGLTDGRSASDLSRDVRKYLNEPNMLFRRVRDKDGNLRLSKAAQAYHPGQGVYRSSYKNALRMTITETNMAYHSADHQAWGKNKFVVGFEVVLSNNHTCKGVKGQYTDICDELQGKYPKTFKFTGWHPHCRCTALPIRATDEEIEEYKRLPLKERANHQFGSEIKDVPKAFNDWVDNNRERAKGWGDLPYFIKDNPQFVDGKFEVNTYDASERKFTRATKTKPAMEIAVETLHDKYPNIENTELAAIYHYTRGDVSAFRQLNKQLRKNKVDEFNNAFATLLDRGLEKISPVETTSYRSIRLNKSTLQKWYRMALSEDTIIFEGFTSSSLNRTITEGFVSNHFGKKKNETDIMIIIKGKSGRPIENISQFGGVDNGLPNQKEILFPRYKKFKVVGMNELVNNPCRFEFIVEEV